MSQLYKTQLEKEVLLDEVTDRNKVLLICETHQYIADGPPVVADCKDCWMAYYTKLYAQTPPNKREESLDLWEEALRNACQLEDEGKFDFKPLDRPIIKIEKDAE